MSKVNFPGDNICNFRMAFLKELVKTIFWKQKMKKKHRMPFKALKKLTHPRPYINGLGVSHWWQRIVNGSRLGGHSEQRCDA